MTKYEQLMAMKAEIAELKNILEVLKESAPTEENLKRVREIETRAKWIEISARQFAKQYGMYAT